MIVVVALSYVSVVVMLILFRIEARYVASVCYNVLLEWLL